MICRTVWYSKNNMKGSLCYVCVPTSIRHTAKTVEKRNYAEIPTSAFIYSRYDAYIHIYICACVCVTVCLCVCRGWQAFGKTLLFFASERMFIFATPVR